MNAVDLLKSDHDVVEDLFKRVEDTTPSRHDRLFAQIKGELDAHAHIEEIVFYPELKKKGNKDLVDIVLEGIEEHAQIKKFLKELARLTSKNEAFEAKLKVLMEDTRHHVKEEEDEMFPMVKDQLTYEAQEKLGDRMEAAKKKYQTRHGIKPMKKIVKQSTLDTIIEKAKEAVAEILTAPANKPAPGKKSSAKSGTASKSKAAAPKAAAAKKASGTAKTARPKKATASKAAPAKKAAVPKKSATAAKSAGSSSSKTAKASASGSGKKAAAKSSAPKPAPKKSTSGSRTGKRTK